MVNVKAKLVVEQLYDAVLASLEGLAKDTEYGILDKQVAIGSAIDSFAQLVSVDIGLSKKEATLPIRDESVRVG